MTYPKYPTITVTEIDDRDPFSMVATYHYRPSGDPLFKQEIDFGPNPTWPSPFEQRQMVLDAVSDIWSAAYEFYTGDPIEEPEVKPQTVFVLNWCQNELDGPDYTFMATFDSIDKAQKFAQEDFASDITDYNEECHTLYPDRPGAMIPVTPILKWQHTPAGDLAPESLWVSDDLLPLEGYYVVIESLVR